MNDSTIKIRSQFKESNILFQSDSSTAITKAIEAVNLHRDMLEKYIIVHEEFLHTLKPITVEDTAPPIVKTMAEAGKLANVGPMAAVAGALADLAVEAILDSGASVAIVENGGEVSASSKKAFTVGLYAGRNVFSNSFGFQVRPSECPIGIATSSATVSHAFSFGEADAATIFSETSAIADAAATAVCNAVKGKDIPASVQLGLEAADRLGNLIRGALVIRKSYAGMTGAIPQLVKICRGFAVRQVSPSDAFSSDFRLI